MWMLYTIFCVFTTITSAEVVCPKDKSYVQEACHKRCSQLNIGYECNFPRAECQCNEGKFETLKGECVYMFDCPVEEVYCPINEIYSFTHGCPKTCKDPKGSKTCKNIPYSNRCDCKNGYVRNAQMECVSIPECALDDTVCSEGLVAKCGNGAIPTCKDFPYLLSGSIFEVIEAEETLVKKCLPTCQCPEGQYFDTASNECVYGNVCQKLYGNEVCQKNDPNSVYLPCVPSHCDGDVCTDDCVSGCFCKDGFKKDANNKCVNIA